MMALGAASSQAQARKDRWRQGILLCTLEPMGLAEHHKAEIEVGLNAWRSCERSQ